MPVLNVENAYTLLTLTGVGVAPYAARGLSQSLEPISQAANFMRTINGSLVDISAPQFRKYKSTISCTDQTAPTLSGIWPGMVVTVECIAELGVGDGTSDRPAVSGSTRVDGGLTFFRPVLTMLVTGFSQTTDEYACQTAWQLELEEV